MSQFSGVTVSSWSDTASIPHRQPLEVDTTIDVCIIGAGIAGLTAAYLLAKAGKSVVVLEQGEIAGGDTSRTTAHLSNVMDDGLSQMEKWHGAGGAKLAADSHAAAIRQIETIVRDESIDCDFFRVDGYLFPAPQTPASTIEEELASARREGYEVVQVSKAPIENLDAGPALRFANQGQFHVLKYLRKLADVIETLGGKICERTHVTDIQQGKPALVKTKAGQVVHASYVIEAANSLITGTVVTITKLFPYRTYAIGALIPKDLVPRALLWDTLDPYHYVRTQPYDAQNDLVIVGGEDHKTGQADDMDAAAERLEAWTRERWPSIGQVKYRWSGQVLETPDGLALIGVNPGNEDNSFVITGDSGQGMTHGTLGGMILTDLILGKPNPYADLYSPSRFRPKSIGEWMKENANVALQYTDWVSGGDVSSPDQIPPGEGAVIRSGLSKVAVYKDPQGAVSACSAVCTHLGCMVSWNSGEKTWDCPCHGSRFSPEGKVISSPAITNLAPAEVPK